MYLKRIEPYTSPNANYACLLEAWLGVRVGLVGFGVHFWFGCSALPRRMTLFVRSFYIVVGLVDIWIIFGLDVQLYHAGYYQRIETLDLSI